MTEKYYKHPKFGHVYGSLLATPVGRACWPSLVTPKDPPPPQPGNAPGQPRYEITVLIEKSSPDAEKFLGRVREMAKGMLAQFNDKRPAKLGDIALVVDGDTADHDKYPYYKNMWVLVARNAKDIKVINNVKPKSQVIEKDKIVGGMKVRLVVTPLITAHGLSYKLEIAQLVEDDGVRFGSGARDLVSFLDAQDSEGEEESPAEAVLSEETAAPMKDTDPNFMGPPAPKEVVAEEAKATDTPKQKRVIGAGKQAALNLL